MYTNKVWKISDLIKLIGSYKGEFENATDIEKLNKVQTFQHLVYHVFSDSEFCNGLVIRNTLNEHRLLISICKHKRPTVLISFSCFKKYKRIPYHFDTLFLNLDNERCNNPTLEQRKLSTIILNDGILFEFFRHPR